MKMKGVSSKSQVERGFKQLQVWQRACELSVKIYKLLKNCKDYGLRDQMQRASVSIASNIAEGAERKNKSEFRLFLNYAKGSAAELRTQIHIALHKLVFYGKPPIC